MMWGSGVNSPFEVQPQILQWTETWAATPLQKIHLDVFIRSFPGSSLFASSCCAKNKSNNLMSKMIGLASGSSFPYSMMLPPPCLTAGVVYFCWRSVSDWQKALFVSSSLKLESFTVTQFIITAWTRHVTCSFISGLDSGFIWMFRTLEKILCPPPDSTFH